MIADQTRVRKLWLPYGGLFFGRTVKLPPPRLVQLFRILQCAMRGHRWYPWRVETRDWFKYVEKPEPYAMRSCKNGCGTLQRCREE